MNVEAIKSLKVLYVEDDIKLLDITSKTLSTIVAKLDSSFNGKDGLELFNSNEYDLIITDLEMPVMNGIDMIQNIRKINETIPIIVTTAYGEHTKEVMELNNMANVKYIMKPVDIMLLIKMVDECISKIING